MKNILEVRNLNKSYKHFSLQDISFSLPEGCITGFIGVNGAGKTTTLKTILGLTSKDSGEIRFFDMNMENSEHSMALSRLPPLNTCSAVYYKNIFTVHG